MSEFKREQCEFFLGGQRLTWTSYFSDYESILRWVSYYSLKIHIIYRLKNKLKNPSFVNLFTTNFVFLMFFYVDILINNLIGMYRRRVFLSTKFVQLQE